MGIIKCSNRSLKRPMGECSTRVVEQDIWIKAKASWQCLLLRWGSSHRSWFETQSSNKYCQEAFALIQISTHLGLSNNPDETTYTAVHCNVHWLHSVTEAVGLSWDPGRLRTYGFGPGARRGWGSLPEQVCPLGSQPARDITHYSALPTAFLLLFTLFWGRVWPGRGCRWTEWTGNHQ